MRTPTASVAGPSLSNLRELITTRSEQRAEHPFLEHGRSRRRLTYRALDAAVSAWGGALDERDVPPGAPVLLQIQDPLACATAFLAVIATGRCALPVNPGAPPAELARTITASAPALSITDHPRQLADLPAPEMVISALSALPVAEIGSRSSRRPRGSVRPGALRLSTSGSTGAPKVVELQEQQLLHAATSVVTHHRLSRPDRGYCPLPLFHINAEVVGVLATLVAGATLVIDERFYRQGFWTTLAERDITWLNAVPAIYAILAREPIPPAPPRLRFVRSASAPLPVALRRTLTRALGVPLVESYGMTEAASQITATPLDDVAPDGSAGKAAGAEVLVRTVDGRPAPTGHIGRIWIRGTAVIKHYADETVDENSQQRFDSQGWLDTGDLGHLDREGYLFLAGRCDDVINRGGELIYPREIQEVLLGDPRAVEAVVVGRPDEILGMVPVAFVIPTTGVIPTDRACTGREVQELIADLESRCRSELSRFKRPHSIEIVRELPRSATGKIQTHRVRHELTRA